MEHADVRFELWTDTCAPGTTDAAVDALAADASATGAMRLEAVWNTEFGETDQVLSLWSAPVTTTATSTAGAVAPVIAPGASFSREKLGLHLELPFDRNFAGGHFYDLRMYTLRPGARDAFMSHMRAALPVRKKHSRNVGVWTPLTGYPDRIFHIWAYRDLADRNRARSKAWQEPDWQQYLEQIFPLTLRMQTALLVPASLSPMQ